VPPAEAVRCAAVAAALPALLDRRGEPPSEIEAHVETCLRCQAELARYRRLLRLLVQLREETVAPPDGVVAEAIEAIWRAARRRAVRSALRGRRLAYASGLVASVLAAVALVVRARARPARATSPVGG